METKQKLSSNEKGFSLIELLIAIVIFMFVCYALTVMIFSRSIVADRIAASRSASDEAENALTALAAIPYSNLQLGGSFSVVDEGRITNTGCTAQTCDSIYEPTPPGQMTSPAKGVPYGTSLDANLYTRKFVRRWKVEQFDAELRLKRVTVAVLDDEDSSAPLVMQSTIVGER